ncbi:helix-turn-helix transcriptional regulator [Rhodococcus sp. BL-253-APC-6A1W]|uniref:helix-turn-helix domain-containing protein n=1 Tax=Rhodococcus sp. BL-253-APC-6A1W TaxID=2725307 RepID=UPI00146C806D|nr:helix-turn-helix transcriptional regulator [Rhodococcus sp. BL-253-APC-6A1W]NMD94052.1 helix-turn-helix transcriptional regulator [Rhodococcus sp. BL-253-APC-6A1W]
MKWNLRWAAARRDIWRPSELLVAFRQVGFEPSLSKVAQLWSKKPISLRLDELDLICAALECSISDLLEPEPVARVGEERAVSGGDNHSTPGAGSHPVRPTPQRDKRGPRALPPN